MLTVLNFVALLLIWAVYSFSRLFIEKRTNAPACGIFPTLARKRTTLVIIFGIGVLILSAAIPWDTTLSWHNLLTSEKQEIVKEIKASCPPKSEWEEALPQKCTKALEKKEDYNKKLSSFMENLRTPVDTPFQPILKYLFRKSTHRGAVLKATPILITEIFQDNQSSPLGRLNGYMVKDTEKEHDPEYYEEKYFSLGTSFFIQSKEHGFPSLKPLVVVFVLLLLPFTLLSVSSNLPVLVLNSVYILANMGGQVLVWKGLRTLSPAQFNSGLNIILYSSLAIPLLIVLYLLPCRRKKQGTRKQT